MPVTFIKKTTLAQVFSFEFCEISKNTFFYGTTPGDCLYLYSNIAKSLTESLCHFTDVPAFTT